MKQHFSIIIFLMITLVITGCSSEHSSKKTTITIAAAASLTNPMNKIVKNFEDENPNYNIIVSFASSGSLLKQIEEGAPIDIFLSASTSKFDALIGEEISKENSQLLLSNSMALITYKDKVFSENEDNDEYINFIDYPYSIGDPDSVPAGKYAYETLESLDLWTKNNKNQITAKSVRQVLNYVESHNVEYGIVYLSDTHNNDNVKMLKKYDSNLHSSINYPIGILDKSVNEKTQVFYDFLTSDDTLNIFIEYGFEKAK